MADGDAKDNAEDNAEDKDNAEDEVELAARLRVAAARLARQLRQRTMGGLTPSQLSCLTSVEQLGPVRLADLAAREAVAPPTLTRIVAALVEIGMVERQPDPDDARAARITATSGGRAALRQVRAERTAFLVDRLKALAADDRSRLPALVALLENLAEAPSTAAEAPDGPSESRRAPPPKGPVPLSHGRPRC